MMVNLPLMRIYVQYYLLMCRSKAVTINTIDVTPGKKVFRIRNGKDLAQLICHTWYVTMKSIMIECKSVVESLKYVVHRTMNEATNSALVLSKPILHIRS